MKKRVFIIAFLVLVFVVIGVFVYNILNPRFIHAEKGKIDFARVGEDEGAVSIQLEEGNNEFRVNVKGDLSITLKDGEDEIFQMNAKDELLVSQVEIEESGTYMLFFSGDNASGNITYSVKKDEIPSNLLMVNTEGYGQIEYVEDGNEIVFDEEYPMQSITINADLNKADKYILGAKPYDGYKFVKWTKDGVDYSTEAQIKIMLEGGVKYTAIFESDDETNSKLGINENEISLKDDWGEAEYQIKVAMQEWLKEAYGDMVFDARIYVDKIYTAVDEEENPILKEMNLKPNEVAFSVDLELKPSVDANVDMLLIPDGKYDEDTGWITEKSRVGILRPNDSGEAKYKVTNVGTGW